MVVILNESIIHIASVYESIIPTQSHEEPDSWHMRVSYASNWK